MIQELILGREGGVEVVAQLLREAMQIESQKAEVIVNFIQTKESTHCQTRVRVSRHDVVVHPGRVAHIRCKVPADFTPSVALFEVNHPDHRLEQLDLGDGLVEIHHTSQPYVEIPVCNNTQQDVTLGSFTVLGSIKSVEKISKTDQTDNIKVNSVNSPVSASDKNQDPSEQPQRWHPPVDLHHLDNEQQAIAKKMLYEESNTFARDDSDIGCIPSLQMNITLKDDIPVQRSYTSIPKPLCKEVKEDIQDPLAKK